MKAGLRAGDFRELLLGQLLLGKSAAAERGKGLPCTLLGASTQRVSLREPHEKHDSSILRPDRREPNASDDAAARPDDFDPLDPATRHAALLGPPPAIAPAHFGSVAPLPGAEDVAPRARVSMEELLPQLVRRIAWAGDRRKGTVQLELGAGRHAGTTVTVHADGGRVRVELQGDGDVDELRARIGARLRRHGLDVESIS